MWVILDYFQVIGASLGGGAHVGIGPDDIKLLTTIALSLSLA